MRRSIKGASLWLSVLLVLEQPFLISAQELPAPPPKIQVVVVEGEAAIHNVREKKTTDVVVLVRDGNRKPMADATVTFVLPEQGAGATFNDGGRKLTAKTNDEGLAFARGVRPNGVEGPFRIEVAAEHNGDKASAAVTQFNMNVAQSKGGSGKLLAVLGIVGAAVAGGTAYALSNSNGTPSQPAAAATPIGITPGTSTVGPPR
jgi:hypothetical protein